MTTKKNVNKVNVKKANVNEVKSEKIFIPIENIIEMSKLIGESLQTTAKEDFIFIKEMLIDYMIVSNYGELQIPKSTDGTSDLFELYNIAHADGYIIRLRKNIRNYKEFREFVDNYISYSFGLEVKIAELVDYIKSFDIDEASELLNNFSEEKIKYVTDLAEKVR